LDDIKKRELIYLELEEEKRKYEERRDIKKEETSRS